MKKYIAVLFLSLLALGARASTNTSPATVFEGVQNLFDVHDTNSLINANEMNISPFFTWNTPNQSAGAGMTLDYWITDQQGAFFTFEEYANGREAFWSLGYQARTVMRGFELSVGIGAKQNTDDPFGTVEMFVRPTITKRIWKKNDFDIRAMCGCDISNNGGKPYPFFGFTLRALK